MQVDLAALEQGASGMTVAALWAAGALVAGWLIHYVFHAVLAKVARASFITADEVLVRSLRHPARWTLIAVAFALAARRNDDLLRIWEWIEPFLVPALLGWIAVSLVRAVALLLEGHTRDGEDELTRRSRRTRIAIFSRSAGFVIAFGTIALMLIAIPGVREIGVTLMASAGLAGLAVGAAAQPALKSLIAGVQLALTEPVRIGDFVTIEGESGTVDDIRMTYVVIRTGDGRRMIVPTAKFFDTSFYNWTHSTDPLVATVLLPVRPGTPIAPLRAAFAGLVSQLPDWDGKSASLAVSEVRSGAVELRLTVGAKDPATQARLRLALREAMLEWLTANRPEALCMGV